MQKYSFAFGFSILASVFIFVALKVQRQVFVAEGCELMGLKEQGKCNIAFGKLEDKYNNHSLLYTFLSTFVLGLIIDANRKK